MEHKKKSWTDEDDENTSRSEFKMDREDRKSIHVWLFVSVFWQISGISRLVSEKTNRSRYKVLYLDMNPYIIYSKRWILKKLFNVMITSTVTCIRYTFIKSSSEGRDLPNRFAFGSYNQISQVRAANKFEGRICTVCWRSSSLTTTSSRTALQWKWLRQIKGLDCVKFPLATSPLGKGIPHQVVSITRQSSARSIIGYNSVHVRQIRWYHANIDDNREFMKLDFSNKRVICFFQVKYNNQTWEDIKEYFVP